MPQKCPLVHKKVSKSLNTKSPPWSRACLLASLIPTLARAGLTIPHLLHLRVSLPRMASSPLSYYLLIVPQNPSQSSSWGNLFSKYTSLLSGFFLLFCFYPFKIKQREQVINSATAFEKCHAVHLRDAFPNVKLYGCDVLEWKIPAILVFRTLYFFNTDTESLVKVSDPLFIKALALLSSFGAASSCKKQFSEKM